MFTTINLGVTTIVSHHYHDEFFARNIMPLFSGPMSIHYNPTNDDYTLITSCRLFHEHCVEYDGLVEVPEYTFEIDLIAKTIKAKFNGTYRAIAASCFDIEAK